jgi:hypothetical protein
MLVGYAVLRDGLATGAPRQSVACNRGANVGDINSPLPTQQIRNSSEVVVSEHWQAFGK